MGEIMATYPHALGRTLGIDIDLDSPESKIHSFLEQKNQEGTYRIPDIDAYVSRISSLLNSIEDISVRETLANHFVGNDVSDHEMEIAREYFRKNSFITRDVTSNRSTHKLTETLYENNIDMGAYPLDYQISKFPSSQSTKHRLHAVEESLIEQIEHMVDDNNVGNVRIVNWGSGPGRDTRGVAKRLEGTKYGEATSYTCIDKDTEALERGEMGAEAEGVAHKFTFEAGDLRKIAAQKGKKEYTGGVLIGILCPMKVRLCKSFLGRLKTYLDDDGFLLSSSSADTMIAEDPFLDMLRVEMGGWPLRYKSDRDMVKIYKSAGFRGNRKVFRDNPIGHHVMVAGYKR